MKKFEKGDIKYCYFNSVFSHSYFCIDIETTGLDEKRKDADIVECYTRVIEDNKIVEERHEFFFSPYWYKTYKIHQIPLHTLIGKKSFDKNTEFKEYLKKNIYRCMDKNDDLVFMAQYAKFEKAWLGEKLGIPDIWLTETNDTWETERNLYPKVSHTLIDMCKRYGIESPNGKDFHRADWDVEAMWQCYLKQVDAIWYSK